MKTLVENLIGKGGFRKLLNDLIIILEGKDVIYRDCHPCLACVTSYLGQVKTLIVDTRSDTLDIYGREWFNWLVKESVFKVYTPVTEVIEVDGKVFLAFDCEGLNWNTLFTFLVAIREIYEDKGMVDRLNALLALEGCTREEAWLISHFIYNLESHSCLNDITIENAIKFVKGGFQIRIGGKCLSKERPSLTPYVWGGESWGSDTWDDLHNVEPSKAYQMFQQIIKEKA